MRAFVRAGAVLAFLGGIQAFAWAASSDAILGVWFNEEKDSKIEIVKCGERYCGTVVWLQEPNYREGSREGVPGTQLLDHHNPDPALRQRPIIGLQIVHDFAFAGDDLWKDGKVYDPKSGNTYQGKMTLLTPNILKLRGFIGISLIGRTATWTRTPDAPATDAGGRERR